MFIAYFDESGDITDQQPVATLAALVAPEKRWKEFELSWNKILRRYKVPFFHLTEYKSRKPPYDNWSDDKRIAFAATLAGIVKKTILFGSAHSVVVQDWTEVVLPFFNSRKLKRRSWYVFLEQSIMEDIIKYLQLPRGERLACVFDRNSDMAHQAIRHYNGLIRHRGWGSLFEGISFENKERFVPLQAADMLAGFARQRVEEKVVRGNTEIENKLLDNLTANCQITMARYSKEKLIELKAKWADIRELLVSEESMDEAND